ncbi:four helix bundle protein [Candidatus Collierbacteria bacterium]|nr:four helix bundle protein [Candidatus Collierbacteria bacterium]
MNRANYEYLLAYKITVPIYDYTVAFCERCSPYHPNLPHFPHLSSPRTTDQMVQAARSGMTNIPEGAKQESLAGYIKLSGVARGSLEELLKDFLSYARQHQIEIWGKDRAIREIREIGEIWEIIRNNPTLPDSPHFPHLPNHPDQAINLMITLIHQANYLIDKLITSLEEKHTTEGGFSENLLKKRLAFRNRNLLLLLSALFPLLSLISPGPALAVNTGQFTAEAWVNPTTSAASKAILGKSEELRIFTDASGYAGCQIKVTTWQTAATATTNALALNTWSHVACAYDKVNLKIYVNGVQMASQALTSAPDDTANVFKLGQDDSASTPYANLAGSADDFKFYNYARSAKQIVEDMLAGPAPRSLGAVGYWKLDEGADNTCSGGTNDACNSGSGGSALDGPQTGMATPATSTSGWTNSGKFGKGLLFDGTDDKIAIPDNSYFTLPGDFTIQAWIKTTASGGTILGSYTNTGDIYWQFENSGGHPQLLYKATAFGATQSILGAGKLINDGSWHHVVGIRDGSTLYTYVDGVLDNTATGKLTTSINPVNPTNIGNSTTPANYFTGTIDEVKLYHYALTADEIKLDYNRGSTLVLGALSDNSSYQINAANQEYCVPGDTTSCVTPLAEWKFDEGTGTAAFDSTGNGVKGTLVNSPAWIAGKLGKALNFNGSNSYVTTTDQDALFNGITTAMSISTWVKPAAGSLSARRDIIQRAGAIGSINGATAAKDIWWFNLQNSGKMNFYMGGITGAYVETTTAISDSVWTYLTVTYDGSNIRFYINGKLDKTSAASGTLLTGDNGVGIGANLSTASVLTPFSGGIDMLRVWGYARSAAQIAYDYNRGAPSAAYKFDECTGGSANDASGNGNTGTITIGASGSQTSTGTCGTSTTTEAWNNGTTGKRNASINLDGNDDYVTTSAFSPLATAAVTTTKASWGGWFYPTSATSLTLMEKASEFRLTTDSSSKPLCGVNTTSSSTLTLQPDPTAGIDNMVAEGGQANNNYGTNTLLYNQNNAGTQTYNPYKFDLTSIPAGSTITSATMTLWTYSTSGSGNLNIYRILAANSAWTEAGSTWNYAVASSTRWAGDTGSDGGSDAGGSVSGTDHSSTLMGSVALTNGEAANTQKDITLNTTEFTTMFANNYGLYARKDSGGYGIFYSSDYTTDTTKRPKLVVNYTTSSFHDSTAGGTALATSAWNHVMCTFDGANIKTYLNGSLVDTTAETGNITAASSILYLGENSSSAQRVTGQLDDIRVYNNALTSSQIKTLMNEGAVRFGPSTGSP